jgi:hypothetical protein
MVVNIASNTTQNKIANSTAGDPYATHADVAQAVFYAGVVVFFFCLNVYECARDCGKCGGRPPRPAQASARAREGDRVRLTSAPGCTSVPAAPAAAAAAPVEIELQPLPCVPEEPPESLGAGLGLGLGRAAPAPLRRSPPT